MLGSRALGVCAALLILLCGGAQPAHAQNNEWTWMAGSSTFGQSGVYGTLGTPAAGNIPGARQSAVSWTDSSGNFWLFGGSGYDEAGNIGALNDLWEFNPSTKQWTWVAGSSTLTCISLGFDGFQCDEPGVYGTLGTPAAGNVPGSRTAASTWVDSSGNLWLFGGEGYDSAGAGGFLNDLWEFNPTSKEWAWIAGPSTVAQNGQQSGGNPGVYGTLGTPAAGNVPGGRSGAVAWTDSHGNLWLFGGRLPPSSEFSIQVNYLNDVWEFSPSTKEWTWMGGSSAIPAFCATSLLGYCAQPGVYGTLGTPATGNIPGARTDIMSWTDSSGHFWLFGGFGEDAVGNAGFLNDLWQFNPSTIEWTWIGGSSTVPAAVRGQPGVYGTLGTPAPGNIPGGREAASSWIDSSGNFWLFGGEGSFDATSHAYPFFNDLWEFNPSTNEWTWMAGSSTIGSNGNDAQSGVYGTLGTPAAGNNPGSRIGGVSWTDSSDNLWLFAGAGLDVNGASGDLNDLWKFHPSATTLTTTTTGVESNNNPSTFGQSVMFTAGVSPAEDPMALPSGTVTFYDGATELGTGTIGSGTPATYSTSTLTVGSHSITAVYGGDSNYSGGTSPILTQVVNASAAVATTLTYNGPTTFTNNSAGNPSAVLTVTSGGAAVAGVSVTFTLGSGGGAQTCSGTTGSSGTATCTIASVSQTAGADTISGAFAGNSSDLASTAGPVSVTISGAASSSTPTISSLVPASAIVGGAGFTLTVNGTNFVNGANASVVQWNGAALTTTYVSATQLTAAVPSTDIAAAGTASITVVNPTVEEEEARGANARAQAIAGLTSSAVTFNIVDFTVSSTTPSESVAAGGSTMFTISTAPVDGTFPTGTTVAFTVSGLPTGATAAFNPTSVTPGSSTVMTVATTAATAAVAAPSTFGRRGPKFPMAGFPAWLALLAMAMLLAGIGLVGFERMPLGRLAPTAALVLLIVTAGYLAGCAGGFPRLETSTGTAGTPAGVYTLTVTGTSGADVHTTTVTLTVSTTPL
jgi:N-acetylneuraminic acid mutarotase